MTKDWKRTARPSQLPPEGDWDTWVFFGGRGSGKTRTGAEWVVAQIEAGHDNIALIGHSIGQVKYDMIEGVSGIIACSGSDNRPNYINGPKLGLRWPSGQVAHIYSSLNHLAIHHPRRPIQPHSRVWADGVETWSSLKSWYAVGNTLTNPHWHQCLITATPKDPLTRMLKNGRGVVFTYQTTIDNRDNLHPSFINTLVVTAKVSSVNYSALFSLLNIANRNSLVRSKFKRLVTASFLAYVNRKRASYDFAPLQTIPDDWCHLGRSILYLE